MRKGISIEMGPSNLPPKLALGDQSGNASSPETTEQFHIFPSCWNQIQGEQNQILQSLHFCPIIYLISLFYTNNFLKYHGMSITKDECH